MIPVTPPEEPHDFDERVRQPGMHWLTEHAARPLRPYWLRCRAELAEGFHHRCAYEGVRLYPSGEVDHFVPSSRDVALVYEWSNYRYASDMANKRKGDVDPSRLIDPFEVRDGWFEILLPSCQMVVGSRCPDHARERAAFTLVRFGMGHEEPAVRFRRTWLELYEAGDASLDVVRLWVPLLADAIAKREAARSLPGSG